jgi:hypothetical protein
VDVALEHHAARDERAAVQEEHEAARPLWAIRSRPLGLTVDILLPTSDRDARRALGRRDAVRGVSL